MIAAFKAFPIEMEGTRIKKEDENIDCNYTCKNIVTCKLRNAKNCFKVIFEIP